MIPRRFSKSLRLELLEARQLLAADGARLVGDSFEIRQNSPQQQLAVLLNDQFDADYAGPQQITSASLGTQGGRIHIAEDGGSILYAPPADFAGKESFVYFVDGEFSAEVSIEVISPLRGDSVTIVPDRARYEFNVLQNDPFWEDYEGDRKVTLVSAPTIVDDVTISDDGQSISFTRREHVYGRESLTYIVDDRYPARLTVNLQDPLDDDSYEMVHLDPPRTLHVLRNDPFWEDYAGEQKITHVLDVPEGATVQIASDGQSIVFSPPEIEPGFYQQSFRMRYVVDREFEAGFNVVVHNPVRDDHAIVDKNSVDFQIDLLKNDKYRSIFDSRRTIDVVRLITSVEASEQGATVQPTLDGQGVLYTPPRDFVGTDTFTYVADNKHRATVRVTVREPLDEAVFHQRNDFFRVYEATVDNILDVLDNDFAGDGYQGARIITAVSEPAAGGSVRIAGDGKRLIYTPADEIRADSFTYEVDGVFSATVHVGIGDIVVGDTYEFRVPGTRSLSVLSNDHFQENYRGLGVITAVTDPSRGGTATIAENGKSIRYSSGGGDETFTYTVDDRFTATVRISYPPRLASDYFVVDQNSDAVEFDVLDNDFSEFSEERWGRYEGPRVITSVDSQNNGTIVITDGGKSVRYEPAEDYAGTDSFSYIVDGFLTTTVTVDVARRIRHDRVHVDPNSSENQLDLLANDLVSGEYEGPLKITEVSASEAGATITIAQDGESVAYTPPAGFTGRDTFQYTVDGRLKANVTVEINEDVASLYPKFDSLEAFKLWTIDNAGLADTISPESPVADFGSGGAVKRDHSETNVQVEGVDEADLIETDSDYLYVLTHGQLVISQAWPADQLEVLSRTDIKGQPIGQYLHGDRLTVISQEFVVHDFPWLNNGLAADFIGPWFPTVSNTFVTVLDVSDRADPKLVQRTEVEGQHVQTRRIDDFVYLVQRNNQPLVPPRLYICEDESNSATCHFETDEELRQRIEDDFPSILEQLLPNYESYGPDGALVRSGLLVQPEDLFEPLSEGASSLVSVVAIDISNSEPGLASTTGVLTTGASQLYVTAQNLYVFETDYSFWLFNDTEGQPQQQQDRPSTKILKFSLGRESGGVDFAATGQVPGRMLNQFSADEYDDHLRIATNISNHRAGNFSGTFENALFVLRDDTGVLEHVGTIQNLALNESIESVRFFDQRAVVTTFLRIDPLFSLDLSDHENPRVDGHLTLPGFASYMQFVDQDHLLTIGRSTATGRGGTVVISLFDVSNALQPILIDQFNWEHFAQSTAGYDHHAFGWFTIHDTLAIPSVTNYTQRVDEDGDGYRETPRNVTEHRLSAFRIDTTPTGRSDDGIVLTGVVEMDSPLLRSAFIADKLYAIATDSIKSAEINDPDIVVDEVVIRPPDDVVQEHPEDPRLPLIQQLASQARTDLSQTIGIPGSQFVHVTSEANGDQTRMVFRLDEEHFVYHALGDSLELERSDYRFNTDTRAIDWHNDANPRDTDGDGLVTPRDALLAINAINRGGARQLPTGNVVRQIDPVAADVAMVDSNGDGYLSSLDALLIINHLNRLAAPDPVGAADQAFAANSLTGAAAALDDDDLL